MDRLAGRTLAALAPLLLACEVYGFIGSNADGTTSGTEGGQPPETETVSDGSASADTTAGPALDVGTVPSWGEWWCVRAEGAEYDEDEEPIVYEDDTYPEGCQCVPYNTPVHAWILDHEEDDEVVIEQAALEAELGVDDPLVDALLDLRTEVYDAAAQECVDIGGYLPPNNCLDASLFDVNPGSTAFEPRPLYRGNREDEVECVPDPEGVAPTCSFVSLGSQIQLVSGVYRVPRGLVDGFLGAPSCLMHQGWRVGLASNGVDFIAKGIQTNDVLHRLGLRNNDVFVAITAGGDRITLDNPEGVILAYTSLVGESTFDLEVRRSGTPRLLRYRIVP